MSAEKKDKHVIEMVDGNDTFHRYSTEQYDPDFISPSPSNTQPKGDIVETKRLPLTFSNVNAYVKKLVTGQKNKQILFDVSGNLNPGEIMGLMGPSGSGKTSLLSILGDRTSRTIRVDGYIRYGNSKMCRSTKRKIGFVAQDDLLYAELTVYETFYFVALLRLPRDWSKEEKISRVDDIIKILGLEKCRNTIIGNQIMRGVSGGERKRVSIGIELLIDPSILFMDEPTSGLDSTTALKLGGTMRELAKGGRVIVTSIHQPSSRLFQNMDKLILLADGHVLFNGHTSGVMPWLDDTSYRLPLGVSIPDHILDLASGEIADKTKLIDIYKGKSSNNDVSTKPPSPNSPNSPNSLVPFVSIFTMRRKEKEKNEMKMVKAQVLRCPDKSKEEEQINNDLQGVTWLDQVRILSERAVKTRRFAALSVQRVCEILFVGVLSGLFWFQVGEEYMNPQMVGDISGLLFFQLLFMSFSSLFQALLTFPVEFQIVKKERQSDLYALSSYYVARTISDFPMDSLIPSIFCWVIYWMSGLRRTAPAFFENWFSMLLTMFVSQSLGLLVGAVIQNYRTALSFTTVLVLSIMLVGGFYVRNIPIWIRWARYLSFIYYGYGQLLKIEFNHRFVTCNVESPRTIIDGQGYCFISETDLIDIDVDSAYTLQSCMLIAFLLLSRIGIFYALRFKIEN